MENEFHTVLKAIKKHFPDEHLNVLRYKKYIESQETEQLFELAHLLISESFVGSMSQYGNFYKEKASFTNDDLLSTDKQEDDIFTSLMQFSEFYYENRKYTQAFKNKSINQFLQFTK